MSITRLDDLDEHGRFKDSLQALLFSLQKDVDDVGIEQASVTSQVHSVEKSLIATASVADSVDEPAAEVQHLTEQPAPLVDSRPWPERFQEYMQQNREQHTGDVFAVTSGIMFLTGSGSHTLEASEAKETAQRNGQAGCEPTLQSCFVSLYNPKSVGSLAYCAEVNVSGYSPAPGKTAALDQSLGAFCAYPPSRAESAGGRDVVCAVHTTANPSGTGLVVRLAASDTGAIVYEARFIVPPPILPTRARTECATPPPP